MFCILIQDRYKEAFKPQGAKHALWKSYQILNLNAIDIYKKNQALIF